MSWFNQKLEIKTLAGSFNMCKSSLESFPAWSGSPMLQDGFDRATARLVHKPNVWQPKAPVRGLIRWVARSELQSHVMELPMGYIRVHFGGAGLSMFVVFSTFCSFLYSSSSVFCISKSNWRSLLILCCSISRRTPACIPWPSMSIIQEAVTENIQLFLLSGRNVRRW